MATTCWAQPYIGIPYKSTLEDSCLGLARKIYREVFGRNLIGGLSVARTLKAGRDLPLRPRVTPVDGCLVFMGDRFDPGRHVGVYCAAARSVIHACDQRQACVSTGLEDVRMLFSSVRFFDYTGDHHA